LDWQMLVVGRRSLSEDEAMDMGTCIKKSLAVTVLVAVVGVLAACPSQAQFTYTTTNGTITITGYTGTNANVVIPTTIDGLPVTSIGAHAFQSASINTVTIPNSVTSMGEDAFGSCSSLTAITVDTNNPVYSSIDGVLFTGNGASFYLVQYPTGKIGDSYRIPDGVSEIGGFAFSGTRLASVTIPESVEGIWELAFFGCSNLRRVYFEGDAPSFMADTFLPASVSTTVYYLPGTTGWGTNYDGVRTAVWQAQIQTADTSFGVKSNQFGFNVNWADGLSVVVEASPSLSHPTWSPLATNTLSGATFYFTDPQWRNYPSRFYRVRSQ
jgi:hypothetical protein